MERGAKQTYALTGTFPAVFLAERQHVTAMTAPVGSHIRERLEPVRDTMVDLLLVRVGLGVALADALGDDARVALRVAGILAVFALHTGGIFQELTTESTAHDVVELLLHKLVAVHLVNFLLTLSDSALSAKTKVDGAAVLVLLDEAE
jgi:hypothetical protein